MALVSSAVAGRLRRSVDLDAGGHEALLNALILLHSSVASARQELSEAVAAYGRASAAEIVDVRKILEDE